MTDAAAGGAHGSQVPAIPRSPRTAAERAFEPLDLRYLRHTRNAATFIAFMAGIVVTLTLIGVIMAAVQLGNVSRELGNLNGGASSNCASQGGTNPDC